MAKSERERAAHDEAAPGASASARANVFTVPPGQPFLLAFARAILHGDLPLAGGPKPSPLDLPAMTILLPTTRAARALQEAFLAAADTAGLGKAMLLPKIRPIAEGQEELNLLSGLADRAGLSGLGADGKILDIPPAVSEIERRLVLTQLVLAWSKKQQTPTTGEGIVAGGAARTPAQAAKLAGELATLIDTVETENVSLDGLADLVPEDFSAHWQQTLKFLEIVTQFWPAHLKEQGVSSAAGRRNQLILAEAARLQSDPPEGPVLVAGVTGSIPATGALMKVVAGLDQGAIVLPALDQLMDDAGWQSIGGGAEQERQEREGGATAADFAGPRKEATDHPEHPQYRLKKLLEILGIERGSVQQLPGFEIAPAQLARATLVSEAMRPAAATAHWHEFAAGADKDGMRAGLQGVNLLEVPNAQDEAETIALIMREAAETPGKTAALVSPDRLLARRVAIRLEAWGIRVDDSAGRPFAKTVPGAFLNLVIDAAAERFAPASLMALLKHPLTRLGMPVAVIRRAARMLELAAFRAPYLGQGLDGVEAALERAKRDVDAKERRGRAVNRLWDEDWTKARELVQALKAAVGPLEALFEDDRPHALRAIASAHIAAAEALSALPPESAGDNEPAWDNALAGNNEAAAAGSASAGSDGAEAVDAVGAADADGAADEKRALWYGEAGDAAAKFFTGLLDEKMPAPELAARDYPDFYRALIVGQNVLPKVPVHPRLSIWGLFEARLQQADVMILGSFNEGTWPKSADPGPWLNRPMRRELGLPSPEEAIGTMAHDFTSFLGAPTVYLTRAAKVDGVPTVPSRWLMRLQALLGGIGIGDVLGADRPWLQWARYRDSIHERIEIKAPEPRPPVALRPRRISVTGVEKWIANPYWVFANSILKLDPLPSIGGEPDAALRGTVVHEALSRFSLKYPDSLPADSAGALMEIVGQVLADYKAHPRVAAFWLPRLARFAQWFAEKEPQWRQGMEQRLIEVDGSHVIAAPAGPFKVTARADRIDKGDAGIVITDYKTGQAPSSKAVNAGFAPQLPLEAAIAVSEKGFPGLEPAAVIGLRYVRATGAEPPGAETMVKPESGTDIASLAQAALDGLAEMVAAFDNEATPYKAVRRSAFNYDYDAYAHLARVAEWAGDDDEEAAS